MTESCPSTFLQIELFGEAAACLPSFLTFVRGLDILGDLLPKFRSVSESPAERSDERLVALAGFGPRGCLGGLR